MSKDWEILTLDGYLTEEQFPTGFPVGTTFNKTFPKTQILPKVTVGLGLIRNTGGQFTVEAVPPLDRSRTVMLNTFINAVAENYLELSESAPDHWEELLLLNLGYVKKMNFPALSAKAYVILADIPAEERKPLLTKHGLHKILTIAAYGGTENIDEILTTLDELNNKLDEPTDYGTILHMLASGVPLEELHVAVQLPIEMAEEIYGLNLDGQPDYETIMNMLAAGVPVEDFPVAVQLPTDMVEGIYGTQEN